MARSMVIEFYDYNYLVAVNDAGPGDGRLPAAAEAAGWFPYFAEYKEDDGGRLLYLYQPMCASPAGLARDVAWMRAHSRPHFDEVFDPVELREEYPAGQVNRVKTLHGLTLLAALAALQDLFEERRTAQGGP